MANSSKGRKGICTNPDCSEFKKPITVDYGDFVCPKCGSELTEVKEGPQPKMWIYGIIGAVVIAAAVAVYCLSQGGDSPATDEPVQPGTVTETPVDTTEPDTTATVVEEPVTDPGNGGKTEDPGKVQPQTPVKTAYGTYEGPMKGGKPNGVGGTVKVTTRKTVSLNDGRELRLKPGDKLENTKFIDGRLVQANYVDKNGNEEFVNLGIANN